MKIEYMTNEEILKFLPYSYQAHAIREYAKIKKEIEGMRIPSDRIMNILKLMTKNYQPLLLAIMAYNYGLLRGKKCEEVNFNEVRRTTYLNIKYYMIMNNGTFPSIEDITGVTEL